MKFHSKKGKKIDNLDFRARENGSAMKSKKEKITLSNSRV